MIRNRLFVSLSCAALLGLACSDEITDSDGNGVADGILMPNNISVITPTTPRGYVAGQVTDGTTGKALGSANVRIYGGGIDVPLKSDPDGRFQHGPVPAGASFSIEISKAGYTTAHLTNRQISDSAGDFPTDNGGLWVGPIGVLPLGTNLKVQVVTYTGRSVVGANVSVETSVAYFDANSARGTSVASGETDETGVATITNLANVFAFSPRRRNSGGITINVDPVDVDGDGKNDLRGTVMSISGEAAYRQQEPYLVVLQTAEEQDPFEIVASNVDRLVAGKNPDNPTVLDLDETIYIVFNQPVSGGDTFLATLVDETGENELALTVTLGNLGNVVQLTHDTQFLAGQEYNLRISARTAASETGSMIQVAAPFFGRGDPTEAIRVQGSFVDRNSDGRWGNGADRIELRLNKPIGRSDTTNGQGFVAEMYVELDLNGTSTVGDFRGELPRPGSGRPYPEPILLNSLEPTPDNGAARSGFTKYMAPFTTGLILPLTELEGPVAFELRFKPDRNSGNFLVDPEGREAPERLEGTATLVNE